MQIATNAVCSSLPSILLFAITSSSKLLIQRSIETKVETGPHSSAKCSASESGTDFDTILQTRRTINKFQKTLPTNWREILQKAIVSATYAPNHKRTEPWRFHLLGANTIRKISELNASIVTEKKGEKAGQRKLERWLQMPGWVVVTCQTENSNGDGNCNMDAPSGVEREDYAACCCAVQNLCLSLHNEGMGTKWSTGSVNFDDRFADIMGFKDNEYTVGTIFFGTPEKASDAIPPRKRSVEDVVILHE